MFLLSLPPQKELRCQEKGPFQKEQIFFQPAFSREFVSFPEEVAQKSRAPPQKTTHVLIKAIGSMGLVDLFA